MSFNMDALNNFWKFFGVASGADLIVYCSIIVLWYLYFEQVHKLTKQEIQITKLNTSYALSHIEQLRENNQPQSQKDSQSDKAKYMFLIRAYNEMTTIADVIDEIITAWYSNIAICNDGSDDVTADIITHKQQQYPNIIIIDLPHLINRWPWAANKTLFAFAKKYATPLHIEWFVTYDADKQMDINDMKLFEHYADHNKYDVIIGSRFVDGAVVENMPLFRHLIILWWRVITWAFNGIRISDVPTWYRMYHRDVIGKFNITSDWFSYQNEIIDTIKKHKLKFKEIPVHIKYTAYSLSKWQSNMSALKILKELIYKRFFFK